jgi:DNA-directed RNA polymerase specialized sigma24 family protein
MMGPAEHREPATTIHERTAGLLACAACVEHLTHAEFGVLPEVEAAVLSEHLSACPDCRLFSDQVDETRHLVALASGSLGAGAGDVTRRDLVGDRSEVSLGALYRVAAELQLDDPDELVQETLLRAISAGHGLETAGLVDELIRAADVVDGTNTESLDDPMLRTYAHGSTGDAPALYYPDFYEDGPDAGRFVDSPNTWGRSVPLGPEDDVLTGELAAVASAAIHGLPTLERRLMTLVDVDGVAFDGAIRALGIPQDHAARALNRARIHVRAVVGDHLSAKTAEPTAGEVR